jgi:hypothetical protein
MAICRCGKDARDGQRRCNACHAEGMRKHRRLTKLTPEQRRKANCRSYLHVYVKRGAIKKGPCVICGTREKIEGYHEDYSKPLEVVWLCRGHHIMLTQKLISLPSPMQEAA